MAARPFPDHSKERNLLLEIAHCPVVALCLGPNGRPDHPCQKVVQFQTSENAEDRHVPEPWNGDICNAPILFISSNPALSYDEQYPTGDKARWPEDRMVDFFIHRFGGGVEAWTWEGRRALQIDGSFPSKDGPFWSQIAGRARDILGRPDVRGKDWALTEIVHCKSHGGTGVSAAADFCADRYFERILQFSSARIVVFLGRKNVWPVAQRILAVDLDNPLIGPMNVAGTWRYLAFLEHPGAGSTRLSKLVPIERMIELRRFMGT